jgi:hypothetical protein
MHKSLNADNTPIGWIEICLGPDLMFQKMPITILSARLNIKKAGKQGEAGMLPTKSSHV